MSTAVAIGGRYVVEDALGRGGMAAVYRVRDAKTGQRLALKRAWARDPVKARKRRALLEREFHTLGQLRHPRIIEVFDFGVDDDGPYYTMELLDGSDLSARAPLPWREACALLRDVCSSLALLHSRGYVHRDVSPLNVRCTADGRAKLIDFGAMAAMGVTTLTIGTPPCVPPEALARQALDARADLFALGPRCTSRSQDGRRTPLAASRSCEARISNGCARRRHMSISLLRSIDSCCRC